MTIEKLPSGSYRIKEMVDRKTYRVTVSYKPSKREAQRLIQEKVDRQATPTGRLTMQKAVSDYIEARAASRSPSTLAGYDVIVKSLPDWLLKTYVSDMSQAKMQRYTDELLTGSSDRTGKGYTNKTIRNRTGFLISVLKEVRPELTIRISLPVTPQKEVYIPDEQDVRAIMEAAKGTPYEAAIVLATLGLRRSEICALKIEDLDGSDLYIHCTTVKDRTGEYIVKDCGKTSTSTRHVTVPEALGALIREQGYIYKGSPDSLDSWLDRAQEKLGMKKFSIHKLRHFFASQATAMHIDEASLLAMGGWSSHSPGVMKRVYRHAQEKKEAEEKDRYAEYLNGLMGSE